MSLRRGEFPAVGTNEVTGIVPMLLGLVLFLSASRILRYGMAKFRWIISAYQSPE
jgi:hypothetical protein